MPDERPVVVMFRREEFYGDFRNVDPKWHLLKEEPESKWGTLVAYCGYAKSNLLGDLKVSRSKTPKKAADTCGKCLTALAKEQTGGRRAPSLKPKFIEPAEPATT